MRLILLSGLGANDAIFAPQKLMFPSLIVPSWFEPQSDESLEAYAARMVELVGDQVGDLDDDIWLGGASFGGIMALHMAELCQQQSASSNRSNRLRIKGLVLLGSVRGPGELPGYVRVARWFRWATPLIPVRFLQLTLFPLLMLIAGRRWPRLYGLAWQFSRANPRVVRWSIRRLLEWERAPVVSCPVHHIHGDRDFLLPARHTTPDRIVPGGGHIVSLTHPQAVNDYLQEVLCNKCSGNL